jgi:hypothetical protein
MSKKGNADKYPPPAVVTCMDFRDNEDVILTAMGWNRPVDGYPAGAYFMRNAGG